MQVQLNDDGESYVDADGETYVRVSRVIAATAKGRYYPDDGGHSKRRGTAVHLACQYLDEDRLDRGSIDPQIDSYVSAYVAFRGAAAFRPVGIEIALGSIHGFAGTIDRVGMLNGRLVILDIKTGESLNIPLCESQTAAYEILWNEEHPSQLIRARYALLLKRSGRYKLQEMTSPASSFLETWDSYLSITSAPSLKGASC